MSKILAMTSNVVRLSKAAWGGDDGYLPGVEVDHHKWTAFLQSIKARILSGYVNTTKRQFADGVRQLADEASSGDLVVIQHSGHGSQQRDTNGDEQDGKDEVLCLHDGPFVDDNVWDMLLLFRPGVRVLLITDTCHSGTMYRSMVADNLASIARDEPQSLNCSLLAVGTSSDAQTSADTNNGGAGSSALLMTHTLATDYRDWVLRAQKWLRTNRFRQDMSLNEVNASVFVSQRPFDSQAISGESSPGTVASAGIAGVTVFFSDGSHQTIGKGAV